jgi:hypothetical protein
MDPGDDFEAWLARQWQELKHEEYQERVERQLGACRQAVQAGVTRALADAVRICRNNRIVIPRWLAIALVEFILRSQRPQEIKTYLDDMEDERRHDAILELRERASELCERALQTPAGERHEMELLLIGGWHPAAPQGEQLTLDACFDLVALHFGMSRDAVKKSYYRVERDIAAGKGAQYFRSSFPQRRRSRFPPDPQGQP